MYALELLIFFIVVIIINRRYFNSNVYHINISFICDTYFLNNKKYFDSCNRKLFNDNDLRKQLFGNIKTIFTSINEKDCILDIGSNVGDITELFHEFYPRNRIFMAEPFDLNCQATKRRFNKIKNIQTINTAIGMSNNTRYYYMAGNMMIFTRNLDISNVSFMKLDKFYEEFAVKGNVFFLKIDVEGYEDEVLFSGFKLLSLSIVKIIYMEYHRFCKTKASFLVVYLEKLNYDCYLVGKYKIIRIEYGCLKHIDKFHFCHIICFTRTYPQEFDFIKSYNIKYFNTKAE